MRRKQKKRFIHFRVVGVYRNAVGGDEVVDVLFVSLHKTECLKFMSDFSDEHASDDDLFGLAVERVTTMARDVV